MYPWYSYGPPQHHYGPPPSQHHYGPPAPPQRQYGQKRFNNNNSQQIIKTVKNMKTTLAKKIDAKDNGEELYGQRIKNLEISNS